MIMKTLVKKMQKVMAMTTTDQVAATRMRVLQMIHPDWNVKKKQVGNTAEQKSKYIHIWVFQSEKAVAEFGLVLKFKAYNSESKTKTTFREHGTELVLSQRLGRF